MKTAREFLMKNGFTECENRYTNGKCSIVITHNYSVMDEDFSVTFSDDLNIYWLVGVLTWYGYIKKDYKK